MEIKVLKNILGANDQIAAKNRELMAKHEVFAVNVMASPGAGKTSVLLQTIRALKGKTRIGVIEGDIASSIDAETVAKEGIPVVQINTGGECHLESFQIQNALNNLPLPDIDLLLIENVGNLVCPGGIQHRGRPESPDCQRPGGRRQTVQIPADVQYRGRDCSEQN